MLLRAMTGRHDETLSHRLMWAINPINTSHTHAHSHTLTHTHTQKAAILNEPAFISSLPPFFITTFFFTPFSTAKDLRPCLCVCVCGWVCGCVSVLNE